MVSSCVNPACRTEFKLLNTGDIYALERRYANTEFFWLCSACVPVVALCLDAAGGVSVRPRTDLRRRQSSYSDSRLRLVVPSPMDSSPWHRARYAHGLTLRVGPGAMRPLHHAKPRKT